MLALTPLSALRLLLNVASYISFSVVDYMKPVYIPAVAWYTLNVASRLENDKERNLKLDFFLHLETEGSSHVFYSNDFTAVTAIGPKTMLKSSFLNVALSFY